MNGGNNTNIVSFKAFLNSFNLFLIQIAKQKQFQKDARMKSAGVNGNEIKNMLEI